MKDAVLASQNLFLKLLLGESGLTQDDGFVDNPALSSAHPAIGVVLFRSNVTFARWRP